jgi:hypothetical protein
LVIHHLFEYSTFTQISFLLVILRYFVHFYICVSQIIYHLFLLHFPFHFFIYNLVFLSLPFINLLSKTTYFLFCIFPFPSLSSHFFYLVLSMLSSEYLNSLLFVLCDSFILGLMEKTFYNCIILILHLKNYEARIVITATICRSNKLELSCDHYVLKH